MSLTLKQHAQERTLLNARIGGDSLGPHSLPDSSVHGIFQARILEWVAMPFSRGSSWPRDQIQVSHIVGKFFTIWATREAQYRIKWSFSSLCTFSSILNTLLLLSGKSVLLFFIVIYYRWGHFLGRKAWLCGFHFLPNERPSELGQSPVPVLSAL